MVRPSSAKEWTGKLPTDGAAAGLNEQWVIA